MTGFFIPSAPVAKGRPRFSRQGGTYTPRKTRIAEQMIAGIARNAAPKEPFKEGVEVYLTFNMPKPKGYPKRLFGTPHVRKADLDNLIKLVVDAITLAGNWWRDDSQVARLVATKRYVSEGQPYGTHVSINEYA